MDKIELIKEGRDFTLFPRRARSWNAKEYRKERNYALFRLATAFSLCEITLRR